MRKGVSLTDRGRVLPGPAPWFSLALPFSRPSTWPLVGGKKRRLPGVNRNPFSPPMRRGAQPPNPPPVSQPLRSRYTESQPAGDSRPW